MTQLQLQNFAQSMGLTCIGSTVVGAWNGYPFMATLRPGRVNVLNVSFTYLRGPAPKQLKQMKKALPRGCALSWMKNKIMLVCSAQDGQIEELFRAGMDTVTGEMHACNTALSSSCPLCRQNGCDGFGLLNGAYVPVHQDCARNHSNTTVSKAALNNLEGNYFTGWIGALLGGVVGLIPTLLLAWFGDMISAWLCALIPLGAYYGYKLFKGKMDRMATVATIISALFQVFVLEQAIFYLSIVRYWEIWPSVIDSVAYYFEITEIGDMVADMIMPLIFVVLGIVIVGGIIRRTNQNDTMDASAMLDSLTDLNGAPVQRREPVQPAYAAGQYQSAQSYRQVPPVQPTQPYQYQQPAQPTQQGWQGQAAWGQTPSQWGQPAQPVQPTQPVQPVQPTQPVQPAQWGQPVQQPAQSQWTAPVWDAQQPAQPVQPAVEQPVQEASPVQPVASVPNVEPLNIKLPDLPDLPETPKLDDQEQK